MTINHIDQLAQWWKNAEKGTPREGDTYIARFPGRDGYETGVVDSDGLPEGMLPDTRILARSTIPKPAWRDAPAVTAKGREDWDHVEAFSRNDDYDPPRWIDSQGITYTAEQLSDVTPLIEAKVTNEARDRVWEELVHHGLIDPDKHRPSDSWTADVVHVALGLETE